MLLCGGGDVKSQTLRLNCHGRARLCVQLGLGLELRLRLLLAARGVESRSRGYSRCSFSPCRGRGGEPVECGHSDEGQDEEHAIPSEP